MRQNLFFQQFSRPDTVLSCAVLLQRPENRIQLWAFCRHHSPVSHTAQILGRIEGEAAHICRRSDVSPMIHTSNGLGRIFNHSQLILLCDGTDRIHITGSAKNMDRQNGTSLGRNRSLNFCRIQSKIFVPNIYKNRHRSNRCNGFRSGEKSKGSCNDLVARTNSTGTQSQHQSICTGSTGNGIRSAQIRTCLLFKRPNRIAANVSTAGQQRKQSRLHLVPQTGILTFQVKEWNIHLFPLTFPNRKLCFLLRSLLNNLRTQLQRPVCICCLCNPLFLTVHQTVKCT